MGADAEVVAAVATEAVVETTEQVAEGEEGEAKPKRNRGKWAGIEGLKEALEAALGPYAESGAESLEELVKSVNQKISKASSKFGKDERLWERSTDTLAKVITEEFVDCCLGAIASSLWEKEWLNKVEWTQPLVIAANYTFRGAKAFVRTLTFATESHVVDGIFKYQEEERINKVMYTALEQAGVQADHMKKASAHLLKAYDEAFASAPYGSHDDVAATADLALLQDFIKGWMLEFINRAWHAVLEDGIGQQGATKDTQVLFVTVLFQHLTSPDVACVPTSILTRLGQLPAAPWDFIGKCSEESFKQLEAGPLHGYNKKLSEAMKRKATGEDGLAKKQRLE